MIKEESHNWSGWGRASRESSWEHAFRPFLGFLEGNYNCLEKILEVSFLVREG